MERFTCFKLQMSRNSYYELHLFFIQPSCANVQRIRIRGMALLFIVRKTEQTNQKCPRYGSSGTQQNRVEQRKWDDVCCVTTKLWRWYYI